MNSRKLAEAAQPAKLGAYLADLARQTQHDHGHGDKTVSVRRAEHKGHQIVVTTTYEVEIDDKTLRVPLQVSNDGRLLCHALPNYHFRSAIDLIAALIDHYGEEITSKAPPTGPGSEHDH